jgi:dienelactone hydrolase
LAEAKRLFQTRLIESRREDRPLDLPPPDVFALVEYPSSAGPMKAYLSVHSDIEPGERRPAVVWLTGGFPAARGGKYVWTQGPFENDQSAAAYRDEGVVMLVPTVRGTADNPGVQEVFLGEVDDVLAAAAYLRSLPNVDPDRVLLAGHSTGGTLALLAAAQSADLFYAAVAFGPVARVSDYGGRTWPFDASDPEEVRLRSPLYFLDAIRIPTLVVEGERANAEDIVALDEATSNPNITFVLLEGEDHFTPLAPVNRWLARRLVGDSDKEFWAGADSVLAAVQSFQRDQREARNLHSLAAHRADGVALGKAATLEFICELRSAARLDAVRAAFDAFTPGTITELTDADDQPFLQLRWRRTLTLMPEEIFNASAEFSAACRSAWVRDRGWELANDAR